MPILSLATAAMLVLQPAPAPPSSPFSSKVLRQASCTLQIRGSMSRLITLPAGTKPGQKHVNESFNYSLVGTLREETDATNGLRFRFVPADKQMASGARAAFHFEDDQPGVGLPPVIADSNEVQTVRDFIFESRGRGSELIVVSGDLTLRAQVYSGAPLAADAKKVRSILSIPLPPQTLSLMQQGKAAVLRFNGLSLWAMADAKRDFTVSASAAYDSNTPYGLAKGKVELVFNLGPVKQP